jgi:hypothetical protein
MAIIDDIRITQYGGFENPDQGDRGLQDQDADKARRRRRTKDRIRPRLERLIVKKEADGEARQARAYRWVLDEMVHQDNVAPYKALGAMARFPVTIEEFVESREFVGVLDDFKVWPAWKGELTKLCPDVICGEEPIHEVVLGGATGTGKTTLAWLTTAYQVYLLSCFEPPHALFPDLASLSPIVITMMSLKPSITKKVIYEPFRSLMLGMPYTRRWLKWDKYKDGEILFNNNVQVVPALAMDTSMQGQAICGGILDEMAFMAVIDQSKQVPGPRGQGGKFDQAELVYSNAISRRKRSFTTKGLSVGTFCVMSNTRYQGDFLDRRLAQVERRGQPNTYARRLKRYHLKPGDVAAVRDGEVMRVLVGTESYPTRLLKDGDEVSKGAQVEIVPSHYLTQFQSDPEGALRDVCGISTGVIRPFIAARQKITAAFQRGLVTCPHQWVERPDVDLSVTGGRLPEWVDSLMPKDRDLPRYIHVDLSISGDRAGVGVSKVLGWEYVEDPENPGVREQAPHFATECAISIQPSGENQIDIGELRTWLMQLGTRHGFEIAGVSYDGFQSAESIQRWRKAGVRNVDVLSLDRTTEPYDFLRQALYQDRLDLVESQMLREELTELEHDAAKDKVDHPPKGCFTGDTRVALLDGTLPTFEELAHRYPNGERFAVYTMREDGVGVGWGHSPRITHARAAVLEVTIDNYQVLRCTQDHLFMLLDGSWKQAIDLTPADRIMLLYRTRENKGGWSGYERVWCPIRRERVLAHHLSAMLKFGEVPDGHVVHHVNDVRHDNDPDNLEVKTRADHAREHTIRRHAEDPEWVRSLREGHDRYRESGGNEKSRENMIRLHREGKMKDSRTSKQKNHRVLSTHVLEGTFEVWDITVDETHNFALASGVFVHNSKDVSDAVGGSIFTAGSSREMRRAGGYVDGGGEPVRVRKVGGRRDATRPKGIRRRR